MHLINFTWQREEKKMEKRDDDDGMASSFSWTTMTTKRQLGEQREIIQLP